jgi:hypothetical protein
VRNSRLFRLLLVVFIACLVQACGVSPFDEDEDDIARQFMRAISDRNEDRAVSLLGLDAQTAVADKCPNGQVIACFQNAGLDEWGNLKDIYFLYGKSSGRRAYSTIWTNGAIWIVIDVESQNDKFVITGWRGLIPEEGAFPAELIDDDNPINTFPPDE